MGVFKEYKLKDYITLMGTFCGLAVIFIPIYFRKDLVWYVIANVFVFWGILFDLIDGFVARKLKQINELGKQLDSLSDGIVLVVAPGILTFIMYSDSPITATGVPGLPWWTMFITTFIFIVAGISRLAYFNIGEDVSYSGLPTPISAGFLGVLNCINISAFGINNTSTVLNYGIQYIVPFIMIFLGWCNITDRIHYGQNVRKKTGGMRVIIKVGMAISFILLILAIIQYTQDGNLMVILMIGLTGFLVLGLIFIGYGFVNAYKVGNTNNNQNGTSKPSESKTH
jgi:phosphatidylserine synthase